MPLRDHALNTSQALLAEAAGNHRQATDLFARAAMRWEAFGSTLEQAYALLGQARCLGALGDPAADAPLRQARAMFAEMGSQTRVEECDTP